MFGFLGDNVNSVKQAAEVNNTGKPESESGAEAGLGLPSLGGLWNVAKAVQSAVQQTTDEVVRSVQQTDWKSEIAAFTHEVEAEAHKAVEVVQHLPAQLHTITAETGDEASGAEGTNAGGSSSSTAAGAAQQPFGAVGSSLANFGKQLISGTKEVIDTVTDMVEGEIATAAREVPRFAGGSKGSSTGGRGDAASRLASRQRLATKYSRFEAEVAAMQRDSATYVDEPEDAEDFAAWRASSFSMSSAQPDIDNILSGNAFMSELQSRLVPLLVEKEEFWARYFYRLYKLQQKEEQRQQLAVRAKQLDDSEDLGGWDDDDSPHQPAAAAAAAQEQQQQQEQDHTQQQQEQEQDHTQQQQQQQHENDGQEAGVQEQQQQPEPSSSAAATAAGEPEQEAPLTTSSSSSAFHDAATQQQAVQATAAQVPADADKDATVPAAAAAATAAISGHVSRKASEDSSFPSTPMQVGSDASDAALVTDTVSDGSGATAAGSAQPWTVVSPRASPAAAAAQPADGSGDAAAAEEEEAQDDAQPAAPQHQQQQQHTGQAASTLAASAPKAPPSAAAGAAAGASKAPAASTAAAAAAAAAAAVDEDDDDDWGDDADDAVAAVAAGKAGVAGATAAAAAAAAAAEGDDNWGNWE